MTLPLGHRLDRAGAALRAAPRRQHPHAGGPALLRRPGGDARAGQLRRAVGRPRRRRRGRHARPLAGRGRAQAAAGVLGAATGPADHAAEGSRRLGAGHRLRRRLPGGGRPEDAPRLDRALLRHDRRGPRQHGRQRQRRRALRGDRPVAARPRPQHRPGGARAARHGTAVVAAARRPEHGLLRQARAERAHHQDRAPGRHARGHAPRRARVPHRHAAVERDHRVAPQPQGRLVRAQGRRDRPVQHHGAGQDRAEGGGPRSMRCAGATRARRAPTKKPPEGGLLQRRSRALRP